MVKVSVLIPVYNVSIFLEESITSVLNQNLDDIELICVNDGSTDNSLDILEEFAKKDSRVKIFTKENGGCGSARNMALSKAGGEFVYFFDPDDRILPNTLKHAYENAVKNESELVLFKATRFNDKGVYYNRTYMDLDNHFKDVDFDDFTFTYKDIKSFVLDSPYAPWCKLYKKSFIDSYDDFKFDLGVAFDDVPFHVKSLIRAEKISFVNEYLYHYRFDNPNSVNHTSSNSFDIFKIIDMVKSILESENKFDELYFEFNKFLLYNINYYLISSDSEEYFKMAKEEYSKVDLQFVNQMPDVMIEKYDLVLKHDSYEEFKYNFTCVEYENKLNHMQNRYDRLASNYSSLKSSNDKLKKDYADLEKSNQNLEKSNRELENSKRNLENQIDEILNSKSWKVTEPLRKIMNINK